MSRDWPPGDGQSHIRGMDRYRLWTGCPAAPATPIESPDGRRDCDGIGDHLTVDPPCPCGSCFGTGWQS
jgi:hypothetical protein